MAEARAWIAACPEDAIEPQRAYQNLRLDLGEDDPLIEEYRALLAEHPDSAANHYLYGRLLNDPDLAVPEYARALGLDPHLTRARVALGSALLALERYSEAFDELTKALGAPDWDSFDAPTYADAAIGAKAAGAATAALEPLRKSNPGDRNLESARWALLAASGDWPEAERLVDSILKKDPTSELGWYRQARILQLSGRRRELKALLEQSRERTELASRIVDFRFELRLEDGELRTAASEFLKDAAVIDRDRSTVYRLYASAALLMEGDRVGARKALEGFEDRLKGLGLGSRLLASFHTMAEALRGNLPRDRLLPHARSDYRAVKDALFMMGACARAEGDLSAARDLFARCARACFGYAFPLPVARKLSAGERR